MTLQICYLMIHLRFLRMLADSQSSFPRSQACHYHKLFLTKNLSLSYHFYAEKWLLKPLVICSNTFIFVYIVLCHNVTMLLTYSMNFLSNPVICCQIFTQKAILTEQHLFSASLGGKRLFLSQIVDVNWLRWRSDHLLSCPFAVMMQYESGIVNESVRIVNHRDDTMLYQGQRRSPSNNQAIYFRIV